MPEAFHILFYNIKYFSLHLNYRAFTCLNGAQCSFREEIQMRISIFTILMRFQHKISNISFPKLNKQAVLRGK